MALITQGRQAWCLHACFSGLSTPTVWKVQSDSGQVCGDKKCPFSGLSSPTLWEVQTVDRCVEIKSAPTTVQPIMAEFGVRVQKGQAWRVSRTLSHSNTKLSPKTEHCYIQTPNCLQRQSTGTFKHQIVSKDRALLHSNTKLSPKTEHCYIQTPNCLQRQSTVTFKHQTVSKDRALLHSNTKLSPKTEHCYIQTPNCLQRQSTVTFKHQIVSKDRALLHSNTKLSPKTEHCYIQTPNCLQRHWWWLKAHVTTRMVVWVGWLVGKAGFTSSCLQRGTGGDWNPWMWMIPNTTLSPPEWLLH